jgi:hypothetical protein
MEHKPNLVLIAGVVVVVLAIGYGVYQFVGVKENVPEPTPIACTEEALLCPDGSYVSRTAPSCAFVACPNQDSFTGMLRQNAYGFSLIIPAPENGREVSFVMPLSLTVTDAVKQLVGQKVRAFGTFTEGIKLAIERIEALKGSESDPTLGKVGVGKSVLVGGVNITLNSVVEDSRCPADVQCIQAGRVRVNVTLKSDTDTETRELASDSDPVGFDSYQISIENVTPSPVAGTTPEPGSYLVTFRVRSN